MPERGLGQGLHPCPVDYLESPLAVCQRLHASDLKAEVMHQKRTEERNTDNDKELYKNYW